MPGAQKESWNKITPALRVCVRADCSDRFYYMQEQRSGLHPMLAHQHFLAGNTPPPMQQMQHHGNPIMPQHMQQASFAPPFGGPYGHPSHHGMMQPGPGQMHAPPPSWHAHTQDGRGQHGGHAWPGAAMQRPDLHAPQPMHFRQPHPFDDRRR